MSKLFQGRKVLLISKHRKEEIIAPLFLSLGLEVDVSLGIDTDTLGTFDGEVNRELTPLETLRKKCELGKEKAHDGLVVASEGSFGTHPTYWLSQANEELVMLKDFNNDLEIVGQALSTSTNMDGQEITSEAELLAFAEKVKFPSHALILKNCDVAPKNIVKGITCETQLKERYADMLRSEQRVFVQTDMRAMHNPKRRLIIQEATQDLINKVKCTCPKCNTPGFSIVRSIPGLPCAVCSTPTRSILRKEKECQKCGYIETVEFPNGKEVESPQFCDFCNP